MSYTSIASHRSMVYDHARNTCYLEAIKAAVNENSVVLDLGAGTGILGLLAAKAGAKKVYLVEPEPAVRVAVDLARANGLSDKITIVEKRIEEADLNEKVDLILSVFTGNLLYSEDLLPSLFYARDLYLKPGGLLIPDLAELVMAPVAAERLHHKHISQWSESNLGLDCSAVRRFAANEIVWQEVRELPPQLLGPGGVISSLDLASSSDPDCHGEISCIVEKTGECHGLMGWIRLRLGKLWLSTHPSSEEVHWSPVFLPIDPAPTVEKGEQLTIKLLRPAHGDWTWTLICAAGQFRHSSFLARINSPRDLSRLMPGHRPGLGSDGEALLSALMFMRDGECNSKIAERLLITSPGVFKNYEDALNRVKVLSARYGLKATQDTST
jgi:precorrin-6B methylase 2